MIPIRFAAADPARRDRIVRVLKDHGIDVRRTVVEGFSDLYLLRAKPDLGARGAITDLLEHHVPGWEGAVEFYWPE